MRIHDLLNKSVDDFNTILHECSQFIEETEGQFVAKNLPKSYGDVHKVKVRKRKTQAFDQTFNEAFDYHELRQRSIIGNGGASFVAEHNTATDPFFIFPTDGYKYIYCREVANSTDAYKPVFDQIFEGFGTDRGTNVITDMLKITYTHEHLVEGIAGGAEIIFYNIPYYYAVRADIVQEYSDLMTTITQI